MVSTLQDYKFMRCLQHTATTEVRDRTRALGLPTAYQADLADTAGQCCSGVHVGMPGNAIIAVPTA